MSYGATASLQKAVYAVLSNDETVTTLTSGAVHDALPPGPVPSLYVSLGPERVRDASDVTGEAALHEFAVLVISDGAGFAAAKRVAAAISDALLPAQLTMSRGTVTSIKFLQARARRVAGKREIEIWFRTLIDLEDA